MNTQKFLPYHAINQFMQNDYRQVVLRRVLTNLDAIPKSRKTDIVRLFNRLVTIPGFRNSMAAPILMKINRAEGVFEQKPEFTAQILAAWSELNETLRQQVYQVLETHKWENLLPPEADRAKMPGFAIDWPKGENYDTLEKAFSELHPGISPEINDLRLMFVWIGGRLPYDMDDEKNTE